MDLLVEKNGEVQRMSPDELLEKAATPIGGITPGGYKRTGQHTYVKVEHKGGRRRATGHKVEVHPQYAEMVEKFIKDMTDRPRKEHAEQAKTYLSEYLKNAGGPQALQHRQMSNLHHMMDQFLGNYGGASPKVKEKQLGHLKQRMAITLQRLHDETKETPSGKQVTALMDAKEGGQAVKSLDGWLAAQQNVTEPLEKGVLVPGNGLAWADKLTGTPFESDALQCVKNLSAINREYDELYRKYDKPWSERQRMDPVERARLDKKRAEQREKIQAKEDAEREKQRRIEEKYLDWRIEQAETRKSDDATEGEETMEKALPGKLTEPGQRKKRKLAEGAAHTPPKEYREGGATERSDYADPANYKYPIDTEEHVRAAISYFSKPKNAGVYSTAEQKAIWGRIKRAAKKFKIELGEESGPPSVEKSLPDGLGQLGDYLAKAEGAAGLPTGEPGFGAGVEVTKPADGGRLAGMGQATGRHDGDAGPPIGAPDAGEEVLSEDDAEPEKQMKPHTKPIESGGQKMSTTQKSLDAGFTVQEGSHSMARANAAAGARLRKGEEDLTTGAGVAPQKPDRVTEPLEKARAWSQGGDALVHYSDTSDLAAERLQKSDGFYAQGSPTLGPPQAVISQSRLCKSCGTQHAAMLSACPACGTGTTAISPMPGVVVGGDAMVLEKSMGCSGLRPARQEPDLHLPNGWADSGE